MATPAQIAANQANAQKSNGPRSAEGKSASRFNALKHGIDAASIVIPGEDPAEYDALAADYLSDFRPQSPSEFFHVETMLRADWQKCRLLPGEADLPRPHPAQSPPPPPAPLRILPRRNHAPRRLAEVPPPPRRGRPLPHPPRRIPRRVLRLRPPLPLLPPHAPPPPPPPPRGLLRRQAPRPRPAPDRRLRTHLVPRQHRTPPPQAHRGPRRTIS